MSDNPTFIQFVQYLILLFAIIVSFQGSLIVWDVRSGEPVRAVRLGHKDNAVFVRQIMSCGDAILCDYGCALRLVRFPSVINKID